jgi:hypothetical protein
VTPALEPTEGDRLLQLARVYLRDVLNVPDELAALRTLVAELMLENAMCRLDVRALAARVDALERRVGVGR